MPTLYIEHAVTGFDTWRAAFDGFAEMRRRAGVRSHRVRRPIDDPDYVIVELDFDTAEEARSFLGVLTTVVWATRERSPALAGTPRTRIVVDVEEAPASP